MKGQKIQIYVLALTVAFSLGLVGCASDQVRRDNAMKAHPEWPEEIRKTIAEGKIQVGMTKDQVKASWGPPCGYCYGTKQSSWSDTWEYNPFGTGRYGIGAGTYLFFDSSGQLKAWSK